MKCALAASLEDGKADLFFQKADLIGKRRLADEEILGSAAEVQSMRKFDTEANLFGIHAQISLFKNQINYRPFRLDITIQMCENKANRKINHQI